MDQYPYDTFDQWDASQAKVRIRIFKEEQLMYENELPVGQSFQDINLNQAILYANSLQNVGVALYQINNERAFLNRGVLTLSSKVTKAIKSV